MRAFVRKAWLYADVCVCVRVHVYVCVWMSVFSLLFWLNGGTASGWQEEHNSEWSCVYLTISYLLLFIMRLSKADKHILF